MNKNDNLNNNIVVFFEKIFLNFYFYIFSYLFIDEKANN